MFQSLDEVKLRMEELDARLMDPAVARDPNQLRKLNQERSHVEPILQVWSALDDARRELVEAKELLGTARARAAGRPGEGPSDRRRLHSASASCSASREGLVPRE